MHLTSSPVDWYAARAAGITAYLLLSAVVLLGLTMAAKMPLARWPRFALEDVHRFGGLLVGSFVTIHVGTVAVDSWLPFTLQSLIVPFTSRYRPLWVGLGIAAAELLVALAVTNHYRRKLRYRFWRRAHYLNFAVWSAATLHGIGSGTDRSSPWALALYAAAVSAVSGAVVWRAAHARLGSWTIPAASVAAASATLLILGLGTGPFRFNPRPWNAVSFSEQLTGQVTQLNGISRGIVSMVGQGQGQQNVLVRADLLIAPRKLLKTSFQMEYLPSGELCTGRVTAVHATAFTATCRLRTGARRRVQARWQASDSAELAGGTIIASRF
ncbi:MAG TPA: ferric reductase-like transmembrane domain-containing protein [Gaiellaceae bacterium]|jgi:sulfoxide reductase heme-binding subunit YedZ|nr:ferric reductase-like transmembrane domain-containing protein [Gaiellaceae bacterium]